MLQRVVAEPKDGCYEYRGETCLQPERTMGALSSQQTVPEVSALQHIRYLVQTLEFPTPCCFAAPATYTCDTRCWYNILCREAFDLVLYLVVTKSTVHEVCFLLPRDGHSPIPNPVALALALTLTPTDLHPPGLPAWHTTRTWCVVLRAYLVCAYDNTRIIQRDS